MNKNFLTILLVFAAMFFSAGAILVVNELEKNQKGIIEKNNGLYIFIDCIPEQTFETIGEVKAPTFVMSEKPKPMLEHLYSRTNKTYKNADGIIVNSNDNFQVAKVIKFVIK